MKQLSLAEARALAGAQPAAIADALELPLEDEHGHRHNAVSRLCLALEALREQLAGALDAKAQLEEYMR